ncbi:hypothetical protein EI94DRAFT_586268 [Lactarius quietus]|nr:hypothetical protein EI94DRAFT_586268 [Lactarius quietus]
MSVASANPFALLLEDEPSRPGSPAPKKKDAPTSQPARNLPSLLRDLLPVVADTTVAGANRQETPHRTIKRTHLLAMKAPRRGVLDGEGRGRGRGRGRGGRDRGRGREFDRHSGTGRIDSDKKIHQGWGGDEGTTELKAEEAGTTDAQAEGAVTSTDDWGASAASTDNWAAPAEDWGAPPPEGDNADAPAVEGEKGDDGRKQRERELEEEDNTISLDEYFAQLKDNVTTSVPKLEGVREANEGADEAWGEVVEHKKTRNEEEEAYFVGKSKNTTKARAEKKEKVYLEIDARFERPSRPGRGGGDRGRR